MKPIYVIYMHSILQLGYICAAGPLGIWSKNIKVKPAPKNADLPTLVSHYGTQSAAHQKKSTQWYRSPKNREAHRVAAEGHADAKKSLVQQKPNPHPARY
ncbi:uncharacterized protein FA14DRAFT_180465 [Meira miltonrushii]|uniref:Uncharacterized protein n=1 Tax=Meira miltonrushii TaxID=1280837 RepID=A0A316V8L5_9BASI|nr:uncharacterized protein FA14DRAFT_180465 [Meira miltonrushii]PWN33830.1 hypothetical protein FA14DRAFT_180465 [Meira miltonrushii]